MVGQIPQALGVSDFLLLIWPCRLKSRWMCINCSTAHLSWESLFAPDYAKSRSRLVLSQAKGFSFPLVAHSLIWLFLPDGCLRATSQQLRQTWTAWLSVVGCSVARTELAGWLLESSPIPLPSHSLGWDAEQSQEACQGVFPQRNQGLHYLNWTISPLPDWPLRVINEVENGFTEVFWLTHLCSQVVEWGLLWPLPLSQHSFWALIPCCCSCLLAGLGLSRHLWVSLAPWKSFSLRPDRSPLPAMGLPSLARHCVAVTPKAVLFPPASHLSTIKTLLNASSFFIPCLLL